MVISRLVAEIIPAVTVPWSCMPPGLPMAMAGSPAVSGESAFEDVGADAYYARAVAWAAQNGVTNGISQALFGTGSDCTRAQIVTFLYRAQQGK